MINQVPVLIGLAREEKVFTRAKNSKYLKYEPGRLSIVIRNWMNNPRLAGRAAREASDLSSLQRRNRRQLWLLYDNKTSYPAGRLEQRHCLVLIGGKEL